MGEGRRGWGDRGRGRGVHPVVVDISMENLGIYI